MIQKRSRVMLIAAIRATLVIPIAFGAVSAIQNQSQSQAHMAPVSAPTYEYEIVSIKQNKVSDPKHYVVNFPGDGISAENISMRLVVQYAFGFMDSARFSQMPSWIDSERYDVEAKVEPSLRETLSKLSREERNPIRQQMIQALLADRMKFAFHRETMEVPVYSLTIAKSGSKLQASKPTAADPNIQWGALWAITHHDGVVTLKGERITIASLTQMLTLQSRRPVDDKTAGLTGKFDITLSFVPEDGQVEMPGGPTTLEAPDPLGPDLVSALKDQLGLKLQLGKGPVEIIVIDHIERPSGN